MTATWLDWKNADHKLIAFTRALIDIRRGTPAFTHDRFLRGAAQDESGIPDVEWRGADGEFLAIDQWREGERRFLGAIFYAEQSRAALLFNAGHEPAQFRLPQLRAHFLWRRAVDTLAEDGVGDQACFDCGEALTVAPRSAQVLIETPETHDICPSSEAETQPETLDLLSRAAGIALDWHDISGTRHFVPDTTKRLLLASMGLPAQTQRLARASLHRLAEQLDRRALPLHAGRSGR